MRTKNVAQDHFFVVWCHMKMNANCLAWFRWTSNILSSSIIDLFSYAHAVWARSTQAHAFSIHSPKIHRQIFSIHWNGIIFLISIIMNTVNCAYAVSTSIDSESCEWMNGECNLLRNFYHSAWIKCKCLFRINAQMKCYIDLCLYTLYTNAIRWTVFIDYSQLRIPNYRIFFSVPFGVCM